MATLDGVAGAALVKALGGDAAKASEEDLAKRVKGVTPEQLLALKKAEEEFALQMTELR